MIETNDSPQFYTGITIIIPSLNPDETLLTLLNRLKQAADIQTIVVNDGSGPEYDDFFRAAEQEYGCTVLTHAVNLGKGRGLKTAFNYCLNAFPDGVGVVTVDADGQHDVDDILACADALLGSPDSLILGCRNFNDATVPSKSKFGNKMTRRVLRFLCGVQLSDTQTGLRAIPRVFMAHLMNVAGERYEFEMHMIIECKETGTSIVEVPIKTIYIEDNRTSHFNPLTDSLKIYAVFLKFIVAGLSSFAIDIALFSLLIWLLEGRLQLNYIFIATVGARIVSSLYNYLINKTVVFSKDGSPVASLVKYYLLVAAIMLVSGTLVTVIYRVVPLNEVLIKIIVDTCLFLVSFQAQRSWVFNGKKEKSAA